MAVATVSNATTVPNANIAPVYGAWMPAKPYVPSEIDRRVVAHLRRLIGPGQRFTSRYALAQAAGIDPSTLSKAFSGDRGIGIEVFVLLHDNLKISADALLDPVPQAELDAAIQEPEPAERVLRSEVAAARRHGTKSSRVHAKARKLSG